MVLFSLFISRWWLLVVCRYRYGCVFFYIIVCCSWFSVFVLIGLVMKV